MVGQHRRNCIRVVVPYILKVTNNFSQISIRQIKNNCFNCVFYFNRKYTSPDLIVTFVSVFFYAFNLLQFILNLKLSNYVVRFKYNKHGHIIIILQNVCNPYKLCNFSLKIEIVTQKSEKRFTKIKYFFPSCSRLSSRKILQISSHKSWYLP